MEVPSQPPRDASASDSVGVPGMAMDEPGVPDASAAPIAAATEAAAAEPAHDPAVKPIAAWIGQLGRTLKTCRLYHASNPTVIRFRAELFECLTRLLADQDAVTYRFTADDVLFGEISLYPAKSRDDNLALAFHRDGVRALTFSPGIEAREVEALIDAVLLVTGQAHIDDDLVTLLWQANLQHIEVDYVPGEGDVGASSGEETGALVPWPTSAENVEAEAPGTAQADAAAPGTGSRSDDWTTGDLAAEAEAGFEELNTLAPQEVARFHAEFAAEHEVSLMTTALAVAHAYLDAGINADDRAELARFVPRMLRLAIGEGSWLEAREALSLLRECGTEEWSVEAFTQELFQPATVTATTGLLDRQRPDQVTEFVALAKALDAQAIDWLRLVLGASQQRATRKIVVDAIAGSCRDKPERVAPWLGDANWFVVRDAVQILGAIGGEPVVALLATALRHPDRRVRHEVVAALTAVPPEQARPLLLGALAQADARLVSAILHQVAFERHTPTAAKVMELVQAEDFERRPDPEKRAIYTALGAVGTDDILLELEGELARGNWLTPGADVHRQAIARAIARIGSPRARAVLEHGAASKRAGVRAACLDALRMFHVGD